MFDFGDPNAIAQLYLDVAKGQAQFDPKADLMEVSIDDLKQHLVITRLAYKESKRGYGAHKASEILLSMHDDAFQTLCRRSSAFRGVVLNDKHVYVGGYTKQQVSKYKGIAYAAKRWARSSESAN